MNDTSRAPAYPAVGGSWHGHSIPGGAEEIRLIKRDKLPDFPPGLVHTINAEEIEVYRLHTITHAQRPDTRWYSRHPSTADACAELLGFSAGTLTDEMIIAGLSRLPMPVHYMPLHPVKGTVVEARERTQLFDMMKTLWTIMQRARR